jgi:hypothetical protein
MRKTSWLVVLLIAGAPASVVAQRPFRSGAATRTCGSHASQTACRSALQDSVTVATFGHARCASSSIAGAHAEYSLIRPRMSRQSIACVPRLAQGTVACRPNCRPSTAISLGVPAPQCHRQGLSGSPRESAYVPQTQWGSSNREHQHPPLSLSGLPHPDTGKAIPNPCEVAFLQCCQAGGSGNQCMLNYYLCHLMTGEPLRHSECPNAGDPEPAPIIQVP